MEQELKPVEDFVAAMTFGGAFKKMTERNFKSSERKIKDNADINDFVQVFANVKSDQTLIAFTNLGNCCKIDPEVAPESRFRDKGYKFTDIVKDAARNERPVAFFAVDENALPQGHLLFYTKDGLIKKTEWAEYALIKP